MSEAKHAEGEIFFGSAEDQIIILGGESKQYICHVQIKQRWGGAIAEVMEDVRLANAERLVLCWNSHDEQQAKIDVLLSACKALLEADLYADGEGIVNFDYPNTSDGDKAKEQAEAAIALATK
ncbi:hypothetical protein LCGC14_0664300 [marine sediment metagenome]|uniref:Uncharacterized protein n=1 Tax=marine sediment metagenome TaxID=412755 RepID=A0A0F9QXW3_9ZZZZ